MDSDEQELAELRDRMVSEGFMSDHDEPLEVGRPDDGGRWRIRKAIGDRQVEFMLDDGEGLVGMFPVDDHGTARMIVCCAKAGDLVDCKLVTMPGGPGVN
jgi:hypothetical protein